MVKVEDLTINFDAKQVGSYLVGLLQSRPSVKVLKLNSLILIDDSSNTSIYLVDIPMTTGSIYIENLDNN